MKVLVGMSGGVDSSVAAVLLKNKGYDVTGITLQLIEGQEDSINDAKKICDQFNIKHVVLDLREEFKNIVINDFIENYKKGYTPNPCCLCNKYFKFGLMYKYAEDYNYDYISTGHYINIKENHLCRFEGLKDQSYFLYGINKNVLNKLIFPLKEFNNKEEIREYAKLNNIELFNKPDSQEICFIKDDDYVKFLSNYIIPKKGNIIHKNGQILGKHDGIYKYTIGQRKGLNISYKEPLYVIDIDSINNNVIVGNNEDLFKATLYANNVNFIEKDFNNKLLGKIRSRSNLEECTLEIIDDNNIKVTFDKPIRAITKGQSIVLYDNDKLIGGGIINRVE